MWLLKNKYFADGSLSRYKTRLVANGNSEQQGVDYENTFSPLVKPNTIRMVLSLAASQYWPVHQLDVKNTFQHGTSSETVYMHQPLGFQDPRRPDHKKYATKVLEHAGMRNYHLCRTPVDTKSNLGDDGTPISDSTLDRSLAGALHYLTFTRSDLSYAV
nr:ribonuclease H-like domain-containing protein [Tanacetum cinerariifolium]GEW44725.1 ribonuclease H-like domain-containing protein [Tanacetum cinerariifolium]